VSGIIEPTAASGQQWIIYARWHSGERVRMIVTTPNAADATIGLYILACVLMPRVVVHRDVFAKGGGR
jgi:hypothetical protein